MSLGIRSAEFEAVHQTLDEVCGGLLLDVANEPRTQRFLAALLKRGFVVTNENEARPLSATSKDPRQYSEAEILALARRAKSHPETVTLAEIRALGLYLQKPNS